MADALPTTNLRSFVFTNQGVQSVEDLFYDTALCAYDDDNLCYAIFNLEEVVRRNPDYKDAAERLGYYRQTLEGVVASESLYRERLQQDPDDSKSRFDLADTLYALGRVREATIEWRQLTNQDKGHWGKRARKMLERLRNKHAANDLAGDVKTNRSSTQYLSISPKISLQPINKEYTIYNKAA